VTGAAVGWFGNQSAAELLGFRLGYFAAPRGEQVLNRGSVNVNDRSWRCHPYGMMRLQSSGPWPFDVSLPVDALRRFCKRADIYFVDVHGSRIEYSSGKLDLGRGSRLANRAQRRALGAFYATCAIPGCCVRYENTKLHHVWFWEDGGPTDLYNLLPLCVLCRVGSVGRIV
jgi:hypothetical protein